VTGKNCFERHPSYRDRSSDIDRETISFCSGSGTPGPLSEAVGMVEAAGVLVHFITGDGA
jgi:hypothetical protein